MGNGLNIRSVPDLVVVEFEVEQENVTAPLQKMVAQIVLVTELKRVNVLSSHVLQMVYLGIGLNIQFAVYLVVEVCSIEKESATLLYLNMVVKIVMAQLVKIVLARKLNVQVF